jgi:hypothetical protein
VNDTVVRRRFQRDRRRVRDISNSPSLGYVQTGQTTRRVLAQGANSQQVPTQTEGAASGEALAKAISDYNEAMNKPEMTPAASLPQEVTEIIGNISSRPLALSTLHDMAAKETRPGEAVSGQVQGGPVTFALAAAQRHAKETADERQKAIDDSVNRISANSKAMAEDRYEVDDSVVDTTASGRPVRRRVRLNKKYRIPRGAAGAKARLVDRKARQAEERLAEAAKKQGLDTYVDPDSVEAELADTPQAEVAHHRQMLAEQAANARTLADQSAKEAEAESAALSSGEMLESAADAHSVSDEDQQFGINVADALLSDEPSQSRRSAKPSSSQHFLPPTTVSKGEVGDREGDDPALEGLNETLRELALRQDRADEGAITGSSMEGPGLDERFRDLSSEIRHRVVAPGGGSLPVGGLISGNRPGTNAAFTTHVIPGLNAVDAAARDNPYYGDARALGRQQGAAAAAAIAEQASAQSPHIVPIRGSQMSLFVESDRESTDEEKAQKLRDGLPSLKPEPTLKGSMEVRSRAEREAAGVPSTVATSMEIKRALGGAPGYHPEHTLLVRNISEDNPSGIPLSALEHHALGNTAWQKYASQEVRDQILNAPKPDSSIVREVFTGSAHRTTPSMNVAPQPVETYAGYNVLDIPMIHRVHPEYGDLDPEVVESMSPEALRRRSPAGSPGTMPTPQLPNVPVVSRPYTSPRVSGSTEYEQALAEARASIPEGTTPTPVSPERHEQIRQEVAETVRRVLHGARTAAEFEPKSGVTPAAPESTAGTPFSETTKAEAVNADARSANFEASLKDQQARQNVAAAAANASKRSGAATRAQRRAKQRRTNGLV